MPTQSALFATNRDDGANATGASRRHGSALGHYRCFAYMRLDTSMRERVGCFDARPSQRSTSTERAASLIGGMIWHLRDRRAVLITPMGAIGPPVMAPQPDFSQESTPEGFVYNFRGLPPRISVRWGIELLSSGHEPYIDAALVELKRRAP
jgi:hypothetical protein